jgi:hypothetical protein
MYCSMSQCLLVNVSRFTTDRCKCLLVLFHALPCRAVPAGQNVGGCNDGPGVMTLHKEGKLVPMLKQAGAMA